MSELRENETRMRETGQADEMRETGKLTLEDHFEKLEQTIGRLEEEDISLEEAFRAYSEGMRLLKECNDQIDRVEKKVLKLTEEGTLEEL